MVRVGYIVTYLDEQDDPSEVETETAQDALAEAARAIDDMGAVQISITKQGDEDDG